MNELNTLRNCPICDGKNFTPFLTCVDYTVSQKEFDIVSCNQCQFHFTNPIPVKSEIGAYYKAESYISHSSTNKGLINKIYQRVRKRTLKQKVKLLDALTHGKKLLDIGAGTGHFLNAAQNGGYDALGLEPDADARAFAKTNFSVNMQPIDDLHGLEKDSFDVITMWHVLEHVYDLKKDVEKITTVLKEDGVLIVAVPNMNSYDAKHYKAHWAAYDLPIHLYHFTPNDISNLFDQYGFEMVNVLPMKFDSFYVSMLSEKYKGGNMIKAFYHGLVSNLKAKKGTYSSQIYILRKKR